MVTEHVIVLLLTTTPFHVNALANVFVTGCLSVRHFYYDINLIH